MKTTFLTRFILTFLLCCIHLSGQISPFVTPEQSALNIFTNEGVFRDIRNDETVRRVFQSGKIRSGFYSSKQTSGLTKVGLIKRRIENSQTFIQDYMNKSHLNEHNSINPPDFYQVLKCEEYLSDSFNGNGHFFQVKNHVTDGRNFVVQICIFQNLNLDERLSVFLVLNGKQELKNYFWVVESASFEEFNHCE